MPTRLLARKAQPSARFRACSRPKKGAPWGEKEDAHENPVKQAAFASEPVISSPGIHTYIHIYIYIYMNKYKQ